MLPRTLGATALALALACGGEPPQTAGAPGADAQGFTDPTQKTVAAQAAVARSLPLADQQDFEDAKRGLVASDPEVVIAGAQGERIWDTAAYAFVQGDAPAEREPEPLAPGEAERPPRALRGRGGHLPGSRLRRLEPDADPGQDGLDPGRSAHEPRDRGRPRSRSRANTSATLPIVAVIFTHSHIDHFGGIDAVLPEPEAAQGGVRIVAPRGFVEEATSENVLAGVAMGRRASFMYGTRLPRDARGHVDTGLGKAPARGTIGLRRADRPRRPHAAGADARRRALRVPVRAGLRGARRAHLLPARREGLVRRRDRLAHAAQPLHPARRQGARRAALERLHRRGAHDASATSRSCSRAITGRCGATRASSTT